VCGRYTYCHSWADIVRLYRLSEMAVPPNDLIDRYNLPQTQKGPVVRDRDGRRELVVLKWGLISYLVKGREDCRQDDQRPGRADRHGTSVSRCLEAAPLPDLDWRLL
jgi:putative SOS response-associated peptidase YedK